MIQESETITVEIIPEVEKLIDEWLDTHMPLPTTVSEEKEEEEIDIPF